MNEEQDSLSMGDFVEHQANTSVFGVVIGFEGSLVLVRLSPTLVTAKFHDFELRLLEDEEYGEPKAAGQHNFTNVVDIATARAKGTA